MEVKNYIGKSVGHFKFKKGLNDRDLSNKSGMAQSSLSLIQSGKRSLTIKSFLKLCEAIGESPHTVMKQAEKMSKRTIKQKPKK